MTDDTEEKFASLKEKVDDLIKVCSDMKLKNQILKATKITGRRNAGSY